MKVEIVSCSNPNYWYLYKRGGIFEVEDNSYFSECYAVVDSTNSIRKEDCKETFKVKYCGLILEVIEHDDYYYKCAGKHSFIFKSCCQPIEQEKEMKQEFTKSDLKNFMRVKYRDGSMRIFLDGRFYAESYCVNNVNNYNDKLEHLTDDRIDIVSVYNEPVTMILNEEIFGRLIWERKEKSEQEIELEKLQEQIKELEKQAEKLKETLK